MEISFHVHTSFSITSSVNQVCLSYHRDKIGYSFENWAKIEEKTSFSNFLNLFFCHHMKHDALSFMLTWDCKCTLNHHWKLMPRCIYVSVAFCVMIKMLKIYVWPRANKCAKTMLGKYLIIFLHDNFWCQTKCTEHLIKT